MTATKKLLTKRTKLARFLFSWVLMFALHYGSSGVIADQVTTATPAWKVDVEKTIKCLMLMLNERSPAADRLIEACTLLPDVAYDPENKVIAVLNRSNGVLHPIVLLSESDASREDKSGVVLQLGNAIQIGGHAKGDFRGAFAGAAVRFVRDVEFDAGRQLSWFEISLPDGGSYHIGLGYSIETGTTFVER